MKPKCNSALTFIKENWKGNPLDNRGNYKNLNEKSEKGFLDLIRWKSKGNNYNKMKVGQKTNVEVSALDLKALSKDCIVWLGHASFLLQINNTKILIDPVLFNIGPIKRHTELPCPIESFINIDLILISHNHRDHLDEKSMKYICSQNKNAVIYTGMEIDKVLRKWKIKNVIVEAGWYQQYPPINELKICYLPAKHWNRRYLHDLNTMLWGSFTIAFADKTIYFAGDSGYDIHFEEIGKLFQIDLALIGMGAYEPNWFMKPAHTNPKEALQISEELKAKKWMPMHYGTFDLSDEPIFLPKKTLVELMSNSQREKVVLPQIGEIIPL
jgi:L-ascorbate metabolism protein UlaG (beta-lactamase superfamily)